MAQKALQSLLPGVGGWGWWGPSLFGITSPACSHLPDVPEEAVGHEAVIFIGRGASGHHQGPKDMHPGQGLQLPHTSKLVQGDCLQIQGHCTPCERLGRGGLPWTEWWRVSVGP